MNRFHSLRRVLPLIGLLSLALASGNRTALAEPELMPQAGEIRLNGKIRSIDLDQNSFVLDVASFTLPNGKTSKLPAAKPKTILLAEQAVLHLLGDVGQKVDQVDLKAGILAHVIGQDAGSGRPLTARDVAVWFGDEIGNPSLARRDARTPDVPPGVGRPEGDGRPAGDARPELALQLGHTSHVASVLFSPDAKTLISSSLQDGTVRIWDVLTNELLWTLRGQGRPYFMADGKTLATFSNENAMSFWDTRTGKAAAMPQLQEILNQQKQNGLGAITFSPNGKIMALATQLQIKLFDAATAQPLKAIEAPNAQITALLFAADARTVASRSMTEKVVKLWDVATGALKHTLPYESRQGVMAFAPDGKTFATGSDESKVTLWGVATGTEIGAITVEQRSVWSIAFSPDGKTLAVCVGTGALSLWDLRTGSIQQTLQQGMKGGIMSVAFAPRAVAGINRLLACGSFYHITLWDAGSGELKQTLHGRAANEHRVLAVPGSKMLVSTGSGLGAMFWNAQTGELTWNLVEASSGQLALSSDGKLLVSLHSPNIKVWDANKLKLLREIERENIHPIGVALSPDGSTLAIGSSDNLIRLFDLETGQLKNTLKGHTHWLHATAFSPDGKTLASAALDNTMRLWDVTTGALQRTVDEGTWVYAVAFSPDGKTVADAALDGTIKLRDVATGEMRKVLTPPKRQSVSKLVFSPDGKLLASDNDGTASIWDIETGQLRQTLTAEEGVRSIAFAADGATFICGMGDGSIKIWSLKTGQVLATMLVLTNNFLDELTADEWITYTPQGYYQGSPDVARFIRWRVGAKLFPAAQYEKQFLRPDLVQKALRGG